MLRVVHELKLAISSRAEHIIFWALISALIVAAVATALVEIGNLPPLVKKGVINLGR